MLNQSKLELDQDTIEHLIQLFHNKLSTLDNQPIQSILNLDQRQYQNQIKYAFNQIKTRDSLCIQLIQKSMQVFQILKCWRNQTQKKIIKNENKIQELELSLVNNQQKIHCLEEQIQGYENANQQQRRKNEQIQKKMQENYKKFTQQKQFSDNKQRNNELRQQQQIKNLLAQNENIYKLLSSTELNLNYYKQLLQEKMKQMTEMKGQIKQLQRKLEYQIKLNADLNKKIQQKQKIIQFQMVPYQKSIRKNSDQYSMSQKYRSEIKLQQHNLKQQLNTSTVQANINIFNFTNNIIGRSQINFQQKKYTQEQDYQNRRIYIDPYYAHFTSQSVKIKQDKEQYLNIDIKSFYSQIIEKRIPMHLWDQWIKNKLKQQYSRIEFFEIQ